VNGRFRFRGFRSANEIFDNGLGALERDVLRLAWERRELSVRDACASLGGDVAYTTVMTTMDRLYKKGFLARRKVSRAFVYRPTASREEIDGAVATDLVEHLFQQTASEPLPILSRLIDVVTERDRALLNDLERLVRQKRQALEEQDEK
jgi:predicted transcriptional regulator